MSAFEQGTQKAKPIPPMSMSHHDIKELPAHAYMLYGQRPSERFLSVFEKKILQGSFCDLPPEVELPVSIETELTEIQKSLESYIAQMFGLDVSARLPPREQIHIFDPAHFAQLKEWAALPKETKGFTVQHNIYLPFDGQHTATFIHDMMHEHVHAISGNVHKITTRPIRASERPVFKHKHLRDGFKVMGVKERHGGTPFRAIEEYLAEKLTRRVLSFAGKAQPLNVPGFSQLMPVGDQILTAAANIAGVPAEQVLHELLRGQLESNMKALRTVLQTLGVVAKEFTHVDSHGESLSAFSQKLGQVATYHN